MKSQQAAEREEQQRIKNLVLNYDLREDDQHDGTPNGFLSGSIMLPPLERNPNTKGLKFRTRPLQSLAQPSRKVRPARPSCSET